MSSEAQTPTSTPTQNLDLETYNEWKPGMLYGRKTARWIADDYSELYIEETGDWEDTEAEYQVKYREGRLGPSDILEHGEFDDLDNAIEYTELVLEGKADLEELR